MGGWEGKGRWVGGRGWWVGVLPYKVVRVHCSYPSHCFHVRLHLFGRSVAGSQGEGGRPGMPIRVQRCGDSNVRGYVTCMYPDDNMAVMMYICHASDGRTSCYKVDNIIYYAS